MPSDHAPHRRRRSSHGNVPVVIRRPIPRELRSSHAGDARCASYLTRAGVVEAGVRAEFRIVVAPAGAWRNVAICQRLYCEELAGGIWAKKTKRERGGGPLIRVNDSAPETSIMQTSA